jgi:hypothetical protein
MLGSDDSSGKPTIQKPQYSHNRLPVLTAPGNRNLVDLRLSQPMAWCSNLRVIALV